MLASRLLRSIINLTIFCSNKLTIGQFGPIIQYICYDYVVLHHTLPIFMGLGWCLIVSWDFAGAVSIFGPDALPVIYQ